MGLSFLALTTLFKASSLRIAIAFEIATQISPLLNLLKVLPLLRSQLNSTQGNLRKRSIDHKIFNIMKISGFLAKKPLWGYLLKFTEISLRERERKLK